MKVFYKVKNIKLVPLLTSLTGIKLCNDQLETNIHIRQKDVPGCPSDKNHENLYNLLRVTTKNVKQYLVYKKEEYSIKGFSFAVCIGDGSPGVINFGTMDVNTNKEVHSLTKFNLGDLSMLHTASMFLYEDIVKRNQVNEVKDPLMLKDIRTTLIPTFEDGKRPWIDEIFAYGKITYWDLLTHDGAFVPVLQKDKDFVGTRYSSTVPVSASPYTHCKDYLKYLSVTHVRNQFRIHKVLHDKGEAGFPQLNSKYDEIKEKINDMEDQYLFSKHNYNVLFYLLALECGQSCNPDSMFMSYFDQMEMYDSDVAGLNKIRPHRSKHYELSERSNDMEKHVLQPARYHDPAILLGAHGLLATARDMACFGSKLINYLYGENSNLKLFSILLFTFCYIFLPFKCSNSKCEEGSRQLNDIKENGICLTSNTLGASNIFYVRPANDKINQLSFSFLSNSGSITHEHLKEIADEIVNKYESAMRHYLSDL